MTLSPSQACPVPSSCGSPAGRRRRGCREDPQGQWLGASEQQPWAHRWWKLYLDVLACGRLRKLRGGQPPGAAELGSRGPGAGRKWSGAGARGRGFPGEGLHQECTALVPQVLGLWGRHVLLVEICPSWGTGVSAFPTAAGGQDVWDTGDRSCVSHVQGPPHPVDYFCSLLNALPKPGA